MSVSERPSLCLASPFSPCPTHTGCLGSLVASMAGVGTLLLLEISARKFISGGRHRAEIFGSGRVKFDHAASFCDFLRVALSLLY